MRSILRAAASRAPVAAFAVEMLGAIVLLTTATLHAQDQPVREKCFRGERLPACRTFRVFEVAIFEPVASSDFATEYERLKRFDTYLSVEFGSMRNSGPRAQGVVLTAGIAQSGARFGAQLRQRWWLGRRGTIDLSGGVLSAQFDGADGTRAGIGPTADLALGWGDYGQLVIRTDQLRSKGASVSNVAAGARLGSYPAVIVTTIGAVMLLVVAASFPGPGY